MKRDDLMALTPQEQNKIATISTLADGIQNKVITLILGKVDDATKIAIHSSIKNSSIQIMNMDNDLIGRR